VENPAPEFSTPHQKDEGPSYLRTPLLTTGVLCSYPKAPSQTQKGDRIWEFSRSENVTRIVLPIGGILFSWFTKTSVYFWAAVENSS